MHASQTVTGACCVMPNASALADKFSGPKEARFVVRRGTK
jgi:hypothetical protein